MARTLCRPFSGPDRRLLRTERLQQGLEVVEGLQVNLVAVRGSEFFGGEADRVFGDGWVFSSVGSACRVGPNGVDERVVLSCTKTVFLTVEGGQRDFRERQARFRDEGDSHRAIIGFKNGGCAAGGAKFPAHLCGEP